MRTRDDIEYLAFLIVLSYNVVGKDFIKWNEEKTFPLLKELGIDNSWSAWEKLPEKHFWDAVCFLEDLIADKLSEVNGGDRNYARLFLHFTPCRIGERQDE